MAPPGSFVLAGFAAPDGLRRLHGRDGTYVQSGEVNGMPSYQQKEDSEMWLCCLADEKKWVGQSTAEKGTRSGWAGTTTGTHSSPWDPEASWKELVDGTVQSVQITVSEIRSRDSVQRDKGDLAPTTLIDEISVREG